MNEDQVYRQAAAFEAYYRKQGGDMEQVFAVWTDSKDFAQIDRDRIWLAIHGALQRRSA